MLLRRAMSCRSAACACRHGVAQRTGWGWLDRSCRHVAPRTCMLLHTGQDWRQGHAPRAARLEGLWKHRDEWLFSGAAGKVRQTDLPEAAGRRCPQSSSRASEHTGGNRCACKLEAGRPSPAGGSSSSAPKSRGRAAGAEPMQRGGYGSVSSGSPALQPCLKLTTQLLPPTLTRAPPSTMPQQMFPQKHAAAKMRPPAERSGERSSSATLAKMDTVQARRKRRPATVMNRAAGAGGGGGDNPGREARLAELLCPLLVRLQSRRC